MKPGQKRYCFLTSAEDGLKPREELKYRNLWEGLRANTTAHGIPHLSHAEGKISKKKH